MKLSVLFAIVLVNFAAATYVPRAAPGTQFITGPCSGDIDCASGCCGFKSGKCAGAIVAQERDGGCGFGDPQPNDNAARKLRGEAPASSAPAVSTSSSSAVSASSAPAAVSTVSSAPTTPAPSVAPGSQFITGPCTSDADCASGCCGFNTGKCAGAIVAQERDGGCGFGDAQPNDNAARKLRGEAPASSSAPVASSSSASAASVSSTAVVPSASSVAPTTPAPSVAPGSQFITGPCTSDADCASGCCGFKSGKCAGAIVAQERDGGCGFGDAQPNDNAARKLRGEA
ncbi:hypothetical protein BD309DRAFT_195411 [Dichomitus squalens]|uniref:Biotrophy-associated secreted protein 2 n=1 Tax=Dichomitus squalens TaxID=114155 RepID=A0A4Q9PSV4_9APHY|nr:uncharacterized protein DICSQDRAFT_101463 [Dichomitus squalens LYAD-421 SS1]EJF63606.1 hypothetical protein DICSQDRAFT_101463 [Dichomitus squalens LYAD-421 SS1]TBU29376.1 hypothetical protein BD311DRAFT_269239 [Dichomitus squalens]TBU42309.1 hypothetical protein BD309DRAFT_195411 [Dichomitus squalens]TBU57445.1 hypothetical protein BD310DRAFT_552997 [Dichomitus squalens]